MDQKYPKRKLEPEHDDTNKKQRTVSFRWVKEKSKWRLDHVDAKIAQIIKLKGHYDPSQPSDLHALDELSDFQVEFVSESGASVIHDIDLPREIDVSYDGDEYEYIDAYTHLPFLSLFADGHFFPICWWTDTDNGERWSCDITPNVQYNEIMNDLHGKEIEILRAELANTQKQLQFALSFVNHVIDNRVIREEFLKLGH